MITIAREIYRMMLPSMHLNRPLRILITLSMVMNFVIGMFSPFYAIFVARIGGDVAFAGFSWAVLEVVCGVLTLLFVKWELRVREQELLMVLGYMLRAVVFVSYVFMDSMTQLVLTQIVWGIAIAIGAPAFDAVYASHTSKESSIAEWGGLEGMISIAIGLAALVGGLVIKEFGFTYIFATMAFVCFLQGVYVLRLPREVL